MTPEGGELLRLPQLPTASSGIRRTAKFTLSASGSLQGEVREDRNGDRATIQRELLRGAGQDSELIKPVEFLLADSISTFKIGHAQAINIRQNDKPFGYLYSFTAEGYAKQAGSLLAFRPRVFGTKADRLLETKEPRNFPVEFEGPARDVDEFEIALPQGYEVEELPPAVDVDYDFGSYHAKSEVRGSLLRYTRTFEIKQLSLPASRAAELKKFYRIVANDEKSMALLRPSAK